MKLRVELDPQVASFVRAVVWELFAEILRGPAAGG
jgi:hypothetical protein